MSCAKCQMSCYNGSEKEDTVLGWNNWEELAGLRTRAGSGKWTEPMTEKRSRSSLAHSGEWGMLECG